MCDTEGRDIFQKPFLQIRLSVFHIFSFDWTNYVRKKWICQQKGAAPSPQKLEFIMCAGLIPVFGISDSGVTK